MELPKNQRILLLTTLLLTVFLNDISAQNFVIRGTVYDEQNSPLYGANIIEVGTINGTFADKQGKFSLSLSKFGERKIFVTYIGYHTDTITFSGVQLPSNTDTVFQDVTVHMEVDTIDYFGPPHRGYWHVYSLVLGTTASRFYADFSSFSELPTKYIDGFNNIEYTVDLSVGGYYNSIFGSGHFRASIYSPVESADSIDETVLMSDIGVQFGYGFGIKGYRLVFTPYLGFDVLFYRLKTSDPDETLPLSTYLANQYYHVTFRQWTSTMGANLDIKLFGSRKGSPLGYTSMHLRMGAGYMFRLSKHPYIKAPTNDLESDGILDMNNLYLNAGLVFYLQN